MHSVQTLIRIIFPSILTLIFCKLGSHLLFVILITNTPMFSFLGASVSYDNLTNLFAVMTLYYLHLLFQNPNASRFLLFVISLLGGALTKKTFLPLALAYLGLLVFHERKHLKTVFPLVKEALLSLRMGQKVLLALAFLLLVFPVPDILPLS